jgi:hypothetical protein
MNYNEYNNKCNKYLTSELNKKYKVYFYNDINNQNYLILENKDKKHIMCEYKILCSYDEKLNNIKLGKDMLLIDKNMIEKNIFIKNIKNINDIEKQIIDQLFKYNYIGYIKKHKDDIIYFILINKIIKL